MGTFVIFDIDGVLVNGDKPHALAVEKLCREKARTLTESEYEQMLFMPMPEQWKNLPNDVKEKITLEDYLGEVPRMTREITDAEGFEVMPEAAKLIQELHTNNIPIICCTSGQGEMPAKKIEAVLEVINGMLPLHNQLAEIPIVQYEHLEAMAKPKPDPSAYRAAASELIEAAYGPNDYDPRNFMGRFVIIEDANKVINGASRSGAGFVLQVEFMGSEKQPGTDLFVKNLGHPGIKELILNGPIACELSNGMVFETPKAATLTP